MCRNISILNNGPFIWVSLYQLLFPMQGIYQAVLYNKLTWLMLDSCKNELNKFAMQFAQLSGPLNNDHSIPYLNLHWVHVSLKLKLTTLHPSCYFQGHWTLFQLNNQCQNSWMHWSSSQTCQKMQQASHHYHSSMELEGNDSHLVQKKNTDEYDGCDYVLSWGSSIKWVDSCYDGEGTITNINYCCNWQARVVGGHVSPQSE